MVIARTWTTDIDPARADEYERFARDVSLPMFKSQAGFCGVFMSRRGSSCTVISLWADRMSIEALDGSPSYRATVGAIMQAGFLRGGQTTRCDELHIADVSGFAV